MYGGICATIGLTNRAKLLTIKIMEEVRVMRVNIGGVTDEKVDLCVVGAVHARYGDAC